MPSKPKSIFKQPGARHFQLVHRSQRDPLIHDPEASTHVLKPILKGKSRAELEQSLSPSELAQDQERANIGEASLFGVYYDDTEYDYMQHLREVGVQEDGVDSVLIEAPSSSAKRKGKGRDMVDLTLRDLPSEALPSQTELTRDQVYSAQDALPEDIRGLQPDMNPHLRQTLEALDDDAFVNDSADDDFFSELVGEGELEGDADDLEFEFTEDGLDEGEETEKEDAGTAVGTKGEEERDEGWEARFAKFKKSLEAKIKEQQAESDLASDIRSEGGDTVGHLPNISVIGGKKRRKGASDASGYSMSSSSMFRNEGLSLLDERFDQIEKEYESDEDELSEDSDEAPELLTSREDFNAIMDDFLDNYEILGGKMRPVLPGETVTDKLGTIRQSLKEIGYDAHAQLEEDEDESDEAYRELVEEKGERWDCETILSTYSNLENHPKLIRVRNTEKVPKIHLDPKIGVPSLKSDEDKKSSQADIEASRTTHTTIARKKDESKEEKRARKQAVKEERQTRRAEKKITQEQFANERRNQLNAHSNLKKGIRKL
ncbi:Low temperature viability protein [Fomitiporia mediterranea MF3/22]|uniref:Low temperature viability protein n=1 Tax=Fomitiporia mediterranea (strain MF3/22) TaxID=694068 RepID=UPI0004409425|nr:Low temperature viability protein [Fomitiporia mediterranea MF3/22]EJD03733.1 Low temperature viability protein [Fomitiporia mediterranea MF3/22]